MSEESKGEDRKLTPEEAAAFEEGTKDNLEEMAEALGITILPIDPSTAPDELMKLLMGGSSRRLNKNALPEGCALRKACDYMDELENKYPDGMFQWLNTEYEFNEEDQDMVEKLDWSDSWQAFQYGLVIAALLAKEKYEK